MKLIEAIALSPGNKASGINDQGQTVIVQERYESHSICWYHVWHLTRATVEVDITDVEELKSFEVDPEEDYWIPVK